MNHRRDPAAAGDEPGFALIVLLAVVGIGSVGLLLAVEAYLPTLRERQALSVGNLQTAQAAARTAYRRTGAFPVDLDALSTAAGLDVDGSWRRDPFGHGEALDYARVGADLRLRSRGVDRQLGTADDLVLDVAAETQLRVRQRLRLRVLRAVLLRSSFRLAGSMSAADVVQMRNAMRDYAVAKRRWRTADAATRVTLSTTMADATATVSALASVHALTALPVALTGAGGLMDRLAMEDARAVDGAGAPLLLDPVVGFVAAGADGTGGTDDDM